MQVVFFYYLRRNVGQFYFGKLWTFEWRHEIEVGDVSVGESGPRHGDNAVEENFDKHQFAVGVPMSSG